MPDYFVRRTLGWNGKTYPEIWYDCDASPIKSTEHAGKIKHVHIITAEDVAEFDKLNNAQEVGDMALSFVGFLNKRYPEPIEVEPDALGNEKADA